MMKKVRTLLFGGGVLVHFKNLEESLLRPTHCLLAFFLHAKRQESKRETWFALSKQRGEGPCRAHREKGRDGDKGTGGAKVGAGLQT